MTEKLSIRELTEIIRNDFETEEQAASAIALHWDSVYGKVLTGSDDPALIREIGRFLSTLSSDAASAGMKMKRKKKSRDRTVAKKKQMNMFPADPDDPEQSG